MVYASRTAWMRAASRLLPSMLAHCFTWPEKWAYAHKLLDARKLTLPHFLGIGAQKAGSAWLYRNLQAHPEIYMGEKEHHYFDYYFGFPMRHYVRQFENNSGRVSGEITPGYSLLSVRRIRFIRAVMPNVRLVFILRNPIDRAWSQARMNLLDQPDRRPEDVSIQEYLRHIHARGSVRRTRYPAIIDRWLSVFPEQQLLVCFYEQISEDPCALLKRVFRHVGVAEDVDWSRFPATQRIHASTAARMPAEVREALVALYRDDIVELTGRYGQSAGRWLEP